MPTFYHIIVKETLSALMDNSIQKARESNNGWSGSLGKLSKGLFGSAVVGRDVDFSEKKIGLIRRFLTGSEQNELESMRVGEQVISVANYPCHQLDAENKQAYLDGLKQLEDATAGLLEANRKLVTNDGSSPQMFQAATRKVNDALRIAKELGLDNQEYDKTDAVQRFGFAVFRYMIMRIESKDALAKGKSEIVRKAFLKLKKDVLDLRDDARAGAYESMVLDAIDKVMVEHGVALDEASWGVDVPISVMFAFVAKLPFKLIPGEGVFGKYMHDVRESVEHQKLEKEEAAREEQIALTTP